jgi:signal transduction histidine kinase
MAAAEQVDKQSDDEDPCNLDLQGSRPQLRYELFLHSKKKATSQVILEYNKLQFRRNDCMMLTIKACKDSNG